LLEYVYVDLWEYVFIVKMEQIYTLFCSTTVLILILQMFNVKDQGKDITSFESKFKESPWGSRTSGNLPHTEMHGRSIFSFLRLFLSFELNFHHHTCGLKRFQAWSEQSGLRSRIRKKSEVFGWSRIPKNTRNWSRSRFFIRLRIRKSNQIILYIALL